MTPFPEGMGGRIREVFFMTMSQSYGHFPYGDIFDPAKRSAINGPY